ncbi:hypothetical protein FOLKNPGA_01013 [Legionella sp. PC1000]|nr:hypothetical protein FOLKNPGA_01013 [Legionella sp. PC1000]
MGFYKVRYLFFILNCGRGNTASTGMFSILFGNNIYTFISIREFLVICAVLPVEGQLETLQ